jgi:hypothetical protein
VPLAALMRDRNVVMRPLIQSLEPRLLLTGLTASGDPVPLAAFPGQPVAASISLSGSANFLVTYSKQGVLDGVIVDAFGRTLIPEFAISSAGQNVSSSEKIAAAEDSGGNVVVAYSVITGSDSGSTNLFLMRVDPLGRLIGSPTAVSADASAKQSDPAIAFAPNGAIAVAFDGQSSPTAVSPGVFVRIFDSNLFPSGDQSHVNLPTNVQANEILSHPTIAYSFTQQDPSTNLFGAFLMLWNDVTIGANSLTIASSIVGRLVSANSKVAVGGTTNIYVDTNGTDTVGPPILDIAQNNTTAYFSVNHFVATSTNSTAFTGSTLEYQSYISFTNSSFDGIIPLSQTTAPTQQAIFAVTDFATSGPVNSSFGSSSYQDVIQLAQSDQSGSSPQTASLLDVEFPVSQQPSVTFASFASANLLGAPQFSGFHNSGGLPLATPSNALILEPSFDAAQNQSWLRVQPVSLVPAVILLAGDAGGNHSGYDDSIDANGNRSVTFALSLSQPSTVPVSLHVKTASKTQLLVPNQDFDPLDTQVIFQPGETSKQITVQLARTSKYQGFGLDLSLVISDVTNAVSFGLDVSASVGPTSAIAYNATGEFGLTTFTTSPGGHIHGSIDFTSRTLTTPTGSGVVTFYLDGTPLPPLSINVGSASIPVDIIVPADTALGDHSITASFSPDTGSSLTAIDINPYFTPAAGNIVDVVAASVTPPEPSGGDTFVLKTSIFGKGRVQFIHDTDGPLSVRITGSNSSTRVTIFAQSPTTGALGKADIQNIICTSAIGTINATAVSVDGQITLKGVTLLKLGHAANFINLGQVNNASIEVASAFDTSVVAYGSIKSIQAGDWIGGSISAPTIAAITTTGSFSANLTVNSINKLSVGTMLGVASGFYLPIIRARDFIGDISAKAIAHVHILAGVKNVMIRLPTARSGFANTRSSIKSITTQSFTDADIAAPVLTKLSIIGLIAANPSPFGIAAERITSYLRDSVHAKNVFSKKLIDTNGQYTAQTV